MTQSFAATGKIDEAYTPEQVIIGAADVVTKAQTLLTGVVYAGLTVLGRVTATGKLRKAVNTAVDGSAVPCAILVEAVDATGGDVVAPVYLAGEFNLDALTWDATFSTDVLKSAAFPDGSNIFVKKLAYSAI